MALKILYSFGNASAGAFPSFLESIESPHLRFIPFHHRAQLGGRVYEDGQRLDWDYRMGDPKLRALYANLQRELVRTKADILAVDNDNVFHPEFLRTLSVYRILVSTDDPLATYARTVPYARAFDHVTHVTPLYNERVHLGEFLRECGARRTTLKPMGVTRYSYDPNIAEDELFGRTRDVDVVFIGTYYPQKAEAFRKLFRAFGKRLVLHGLWDWKAHVKYVRDAHAVRLVRSVSNAGLVSLYQRAKVGINIHADEFSLGNQRLYQLPANGVMQVSDCAKSMREFFEPEHEIATYTSIDECIDKVEHFLAHPAEREEMARLAFRRTMAEYRFETIWERFGDELRALPELRASN